MTLNGWVTGKGMELGADLGKGIRPTILVKPLETCLDVGMGKVISDLSGAVVSLSMRQGMGASQ